MTSLHHRARVTELLKNSAVKWPPIPVEQIAISLGAKVERTQLPDSVSGLLYRHKNEINPIIIVNALHSSARQRFTIAHEIGHLLFHKDAEACVNREFSVQFRDENSSKAEIKSEIEANQFAAELLIPEEFLRKELPLKITGLLNEAFLSQLSEKYQVSSQALVIRLTRLGYL